MKSKVLVFAFMLLMGECIMAQTEREKYEQWKRQQLKSYSDYKKKTRAEYDAFRARSNAEYAEFIRKGWKQMPVEPASPAPPKPKPVQPIVAPENVPPAEVPILIDTVIDVEEMPIVHELPPLESPDAPKPVVKPAKEFACAFYGTSIALAWNEAMRYSIKDLDQETLAEVWGMLSGQAYEPFLNDVIRVASELELSEWGIVDLVRGVAGDCFGGECSEATFLTNYLLSQIGVKCVLGYDDYQLVLFVAMNCEVYNYQYLQIDGDMYYLLTPTLAESFMVLQQPFPESVAINVRMDKLPSLDIVPTPSRSFSSQQFPRINVTISENKNLIDFLSHCPITDRWHEYALANLSTKVKDVLYPVFRNQIRGKSEEAAANMILDFVQNGFEYATDQEQFGYERPLYADESFFYPYNDCEDRSILFSVLVRDLLGLDVVLLEFPKHLATAVKFRSNVTGDYLDLEDGRYIVCDPTYINAPVGMAMPENKKENVTIHRLK